MKKSTVLMAMLLIASMQLWSQSRQQQTLVLNSRSQVSSVVASGGGVGLAKGAAVLDMDKKVGEEVCFTLTAKDKNGNVIRSWNVSGGPTTITLKNSDANTDSSTRSWNSDPDGYSWAQITHNGVPLTQVGPNEWSIPAADFDSLGQARICLVHTKAARGVTLQITPLFTGLNQETDRMNFTETDITNYLVEITSQVAGKDAVYQMRAFEIVVTPRDRYLNPNNTEITTRFSARWPGEFDNTAPNLADIFSGDVFISGPTNYLIASRIARELPSDVAQYIMAYSVNDQRVNGRTNDFEVLRHAPNPFALVAPPDHSIISLDKGQSFDPVNFTWVKAVPQDPFNNIQTSRFDPRTYTDDVRYTLVFVDSISIARAERFASNNIGVEAGLTLTKQQLQDVVYKISGTTSTRRYQLVWYVEATDGLYITLSSPPNQDPNNQPGYHLSFDILASSPVVSTPRQLALGQNYPNPFNPATTISFALPHSGRVSLRVYDLLGAPVATVLDEVREAGEYTVSFNASALPSGTYVYKLQADGRTLTRRMTLMK